MATTFKLPKVTEYVKNVGKSIAFASIDTVKEQTPGIKDFLDTNDDIFKEVYSSVKNYRSTIKTAEKSIKQSNVYQAVEAGIKNMIEDAKTGKFYNDRTGEVGESALGFDDFDSDMEFSTSEEGSSSSSSSDSFSDAIGAAATAQATAVAQSTNMIVQSNKASTKLIMAHMDRTNAALTSSIGSVYSAVSMTNAFLHGPMKAHLENSRRFYEESLKSTNEINLMLKEMLEMQRNLYKAEGAKQKESRLDQSMGYDGSIDIRGYAKNIKSNIEDIADELGLSALKMDMGGGNPYMLYAAAPFKLIMGPMMDRLMSKDFKKALASFDKGVTTMFSQLVARMNTARKRDDGSFMSILGKLFGIDIDLKEKIDPSNYKKDAVPFDGKTRQAIIETIPGYLARIEAALTGHGERHYDFQSGTWKGAKQIEKEFDDDKNRAIAYANRDLINQTERFISKSKMDPKGKKASKLRKDTFDVAQYLFANSGDFNPNDLVKMFGKDGYKRLVKIFGMDAIRTAAPNNMRAVQDFSKKRAAQEAEGGIQRQLFNGAYDIYGIGDGKRHNPSDFKAGGTGILAMSKDKKGHNIFWYLNTIIETIRNNRSGKKGKSSSVPRARQSRSRASRNSSSSSSSSSDDGGPDGEDNYDKDVDRFFELADDEERKRKEEEDRNGGKVGTWLKEKLGDSKVGQWFYEKFGKTLGKVLSKPMEYATNLLNKADHSMFKLIFGENELKDKDGKPIKSIFDAIINKVSDAFDEIKKKFKDGFDRIFKPLIDKYVKPVTDQMKEMFKSAWGRTKKAVNNVFVDPIQKGIAEVSHYGQGAEFAKAASAATGKNRHEIQMALHKRSMTAKEWKALDSAIRRKEWEKKVANGGVASADEVAGKASSKDKKDPGAAEIITSAYGRYVTKRGLTMISPGEMIIPASFDKKEQRKMLALEKRDRNRINRSIGLHAAGTVNTDDLKKNLQNIYNENKGSGAKNIASGIMGAGAGLLIGNPLLGAMAGAGLSILNNSETFKTAVFGKEMEDGSREGGLIPKKIQDFMKKALPDMGDFGIAGGLLGLITPFGPLGGAAIGAGIGALKNSEGFKKFIFGDEETGKDGLISKKTAEKAKEFMLKAAPKAAIGAIAGAFLGPFGLIGNAAMGAGAGLIASTDTFQNLLFGEEKDENGKHKGTGGIFGAINRGILDPAKEKIGEFLNDFKEYTKKHILEPLKNFWKPFQQSIKNTIVGVGDKVKDFLNDMFEKKVGLPIYDFLQEKLFKPLTKTFFTILKAPITVGKAIVAAPFKALGGIGNSMRMSQIRKGTAYDMSASERLAWRDQHKGRARFRSLFGKDKMIEQDEMLAGMDTEQLAALSKGTRAGLETVESLQKSRTKATNAVKNEFSKFFNEKVDGKTRFSRVNYKKVNKLLERIQEKGDINLAEKEIMKIEGLSNEEKTKLLDSVRSKIEEVKDITDTYDFAKKGTAEVDKQIEAILGHKVSKRSQKRQIYRSAEAELKARRAAASAATAKGEEVTPETGAIKGFHEEYATKTQRLIDLITGISTSVEAYTGIKNRTLTKDKYKDFKRQERMKASGIIPEQIEANKASSLARKQAKMQTQASAGVEDIVSHSEDAKKTNASKANPISFFKNLFSKKPHEDSKEATDARKDAEENAKDEKSANNAERESAGWLKKLYTKLFGDKQKEKKNGSGGLLGSIGSAIGGVFEFLGGPLKSIAKIGLPVVGIAGGVSLLGYAAKWVNTDFWPKLREIMFGDPSDPTDGIVEKIGIKLKGALIGTPDDPGLFYKFVNPDTTIGKFFNFVGNELSIMKNKGFFQYFAQDVMPPLVDKFVTGWGYAMEYIVAPLTTLVVKNLPKMLVSLAKGLIKGIGAAIFNKDLKRNSKEDLEISANTSGFSSHHSALSSSLSGDVSDRIKKAFGSGSTAMGGGDVKATATVNWSNMFDTNYAAADETYDAQGNHLNKTSDEILYKKAPGLAGLLGAKQATNEIYYDENGNIALDSYKQMNTTDSIGSKAWKAGKRSFLHGVLGRKSGIGKLLGKTSAKGVGKGWLKGTTGIVGAGVKGVGKGINASNKAGLGLNKFFSNAYLDTATQKQYKNLAKQLSEAGAGSFDDIYKSIIEKGVNETSKGLIKGSSDKALKHTIFESTKSTNSNIKKLKSTYGVDDVLETAAKSSDEVAEAAVKGSTKVGSKSLTKILGDKVKNTNLGKSVTAVTDGVKEAATNSKVGKTVAKVADGAKDILSKIKGKILSFFDEIASNSKIMALFQKAAKKGGSGAIAKALRKIGTKLADSAIGKLGKKVLTKVAAAVGKYIPYLNIALYVADFLHGYNNADTILGVAKGDEYKVGFGQKCLCGLLNLITANLTLGLVPNETVVDIIIEFLFPIFGLDASELQAARDRADNILDEWNKAHPDETYSNLEDFNNKDKLWTKVKKGVGKAATKVWGGIKDVAGKAWDGTKKLAGNIKDGAVNLYNKVKDSKFGQAVGAGFNKVKEFGGNAVDFVKKGFNAVGNKVKEGFGKAVDIGKFIKDITTNTLKSAIDPEYKWDIDQYLDEDDPLSGAKKTIHSVMKIPLTVVGLVARIGKNIFDKVKGFVVDVKDGFKDAWGDIAAVGKGEYTVFHKDYWKFNDDKEDGENPLGIVSKVASTMLKVISIPQAMLGYVGSKVWQGIKAVVNGAKEGILDASSDVKSVRKGQYTIFSKQYWDSDKSTGDNEISKMGSIFGFVSRVFQAPSAMLGWVGTKVWTMLKSIISGAKEGILDAKTDVEAVKSGQYTIFNKDYWKSDEDPENPLSKMGSIFGFVSRVFQAPSAMLGWVGNKVWGFIKTMINGAKEGALDAKSDVDAVKKGEYTIFNKNYWKSDENPENPLSKVGSIFGFVSRVFQAPVAMLGWTGTKVKELFTKIVNDAKEGALDASKDVNAVKKGEYTIFNKKYWTSEDDGDNPLSKLGSVFGFVTRLSQAPMAMLGYTFTKVKEGFEKIINGVKDLQEENDKVFKKVEDGDLSIFDKEYWKVTVDEDNPLGVLGKVFSFIERLVKAPILLIKGIFGKIGDMFSGILDFLGLDSLDEMTGGKADGEGRRGHGRRKYKGLSGMGHAYQSDSVIANMRYGDSTIGKSGCAPVAATNIINNINPNTMDVRRAAAYAEKNGLTVRGGGTDMRYFNKFLGSQGIATLNTRNKDAVMAALKNGHQVIMLGQDGSNAPGVPFGTNPHFITATGIDKNGNIIVQDPDLPQSSVVYNKNKLLKSMSNSIITDGSKVRSRKGQLHGLGRRLWWGGSGDEEAQEVSVDNLMSELGNLGTNAIKAIFGDTYTALYGSDEDSGTTGSTTTSANINLTGNTNAEKIWNFLISKGYTKAGAAGVMGNLYAESGLNPKNIQNSYESKYGDDDAYTKAVDNKSRGKEAFAKDSAGYGLAQWTYHTRKRGLYEATVDQGKSIADLGGQLTYLDAELQKYTDLYKALKSTTSVNTASDRVLKEFERPAVLNVDARRGYSNTMYNQYAGSGRAASALNSYGTYDEYYGGARVADRQTRPVVDYATFLQTIVTLLTNISGNTAILTKILEILSKHFDIKIDKAEIEAAANTMSREQTMAALNDLVQRSGGSNSKVSKLLNTQDTDYIFAAMAALAQE